MKIVRGVTVAALFLSIAAWSGMVAKAVETAAPGAAPAADLAVLKLVPEDALAVAIVNHMDRADDHLAKLAQEIQAPVPSLLPLLKAEAGVQEGIDDHGPALMAILPGKSASAEPVTIEFIPVTDYKKFLAPLNPDDATAKIATVKFGGTPSVVAHKGGFAVVAQQGRQGHVGKVAHPAAQHRAGDRALGRLDRRA